MSQIQTSVWSETAASNNTATPNGWPEGMTLAAVNNCAREMMSAIKILYNRTHATVIAGGTADALTLTYGTAPTAYTSGMRFMFYTAGSANTSTAPTMNVNALGAKTIYKRDGSTALAAGDLVANSLYEIVYDGTNMRLMQTGV